MKKNILILFCCKLLIFKFLFDVTQTIFIMKTIKKSSFTILMFSGLFCFSQQAANPLANTEWKGIANIPVPAEVNFKFHTDQVDLIYMGNVVEKMKYSFTDQGSLKLVKIEGNSPCDAKEEGLYKYQVADDTLTLAIINDPCTDRQAAFDGNGYKKVLSEAAAK